MIQKLERIIRIRKIVPILISIIIGMLYVGHELILRYNKYGDFSMDVLSIMFIITYILLFLVLGYTTSIVISNGLEEKLKNEKIRQLVMNLFSNGEIQVEIIELPDNVSNFLIEISANYELKYFADKEDEENIKISVRDSEGNNILLKKQKYDEFYKVFRKKLNNTTYTFKDINN